MSKIAYTLSDILQAVVSRTTMGFYTVEEPIERAYLVQGVEYPYTMSVYEHRESKDSASILVHVLGDLWMMIRAFNAQEPDILLFSGANMLLHQKKQRQVVAGTFRSTFKSYLQAKGLLIADYKFKNGEWKRVKETAAGNDGGRPTATQEAGLAALEKLSGS